MGSASWLVPAAGWLAIVSGAVVALLGLLLFGAIFSGGGVPVSGAGLFVVLTLGAGPVLMLAGAAIVASGFKLIAGFAWARTALEIFSWIALCASAGWLIYSASHLRNIHFIDVFRGSLFFLVTGAPAILMILLLRSDAIGRAMTK
jgi:hypothetical protein